MTFRPVYFIVLLSVFYSCSDEDIVVLEECNPLELNPNTDWKGPYTGESDTVAYIPDTYADYWLFAVDRSQLHNTYIQVNANYGMARYMSYNVYDAKELSTLGSIFDKEIVPHCDSYNLYTPNQNSNGDRTTYSVNIVPDHLNLELENQLQFDDEIDSIIVILRYYVGEFDYMAGVPLPSIIGKNGMDGTNEELDFISNINAPSLSPFTSQLNTLAQAGILNEIGFWRNAGNGLLQNFDNKYLIGTSIVNENEVAVIKCKPPTYEADFSQTKPVRFWSMNIGDNKTFTYNGIKDEDAVVAEDGWTYFVFAREDHEVEARCISSNLNFIEWSMPTDTAFFLYRNLVSSNFAGNMDRVPTITPAESVLSLIFKNARNHIGAYAPRGQRMTIEQFLNWY